MRLVRIGVLLAMLLVYGIAFFLAKMASWKIGQNRPGW